MSPSALDLHRDLIEDLIKRGNERLFTSAEPFLVVPPSIFHGLGFLSDPSGTLCIRLFCINDLPRQLCSVSYDISF